MTGADRAERNALAREWAAGTGRSLVGRPLEEARAAATGAGLTVKTVAEGAASTMEFGIGRVRIQVDQTDRVTAVTAG